MSESLDKMSPGLRKRVLAAMARDNAAAVAAGKQISYLDPAKAGIDVEEALACA